MCLLVKCATHCWSINTFHNDIMLCLHISIGAVSNIPKIILILQVPADNPAAMDAILRAMTKNYDGYVRRDAYSFSSYSDLYTNL